jgi:phytoene desaturase
MYKRRESVIVGGGLGGLSAAIHLSLAGHKVAIFEAHSRTGGRANLFTSAGFRFDTGPSLLNYPWVFEDLFRAAGRDLRNYLHLIRVDPSIEFVWPDGTTLQLTSDTSRLAAQFEIFEPGAASALDRFLADAKAKYTVAFQKLVCRNEDNPLRWLGVLSLREVAGLSLSRSLYSELRRFFRSRYIVEALGSYGMYLGGSPFDLPGLFSMLPYGEIALGLWLPRGGMYALVEAMEALARETGVLIYTGQRVKRIIVRGNLAVGIELEDGSRYACTTVVSNVDVPQTDAVLLGRRPRRLRMTPGVLTFYWGLRKELGNLRHHTIFLPEDYRGAFDELFRMGRIPSDLPFYTSVPSRTDPTLAPKGSTAMFVLVPTPVLSRLGRANWEELVATVRRRVLDRLRLHGVSIGAEDFVVEHLMTPEDWRSRFGLYDGSAFGAAHNLMQMGPFRPRNYSREIGNLYYVGASTTPGTGLPMVVLSGRMVAERIASHAR